MTNFSQDQSASRPARDFGPGKYLSSTAIKEYLLCPKKYFLHRVEKFRPAFVPSAMVLGRSVHTAVEFFYGHTQEVGRKPGFDGVLETFRRALAAETQEPRIPIRYDDGEGPSDLEATGRALLEVFYSQVDVGRVISVEQPFRVPLEGSGWDLVGYFDRLEADGDGHPFIGELKTSSKKWSNQQLTYNVQFDAYAVGLAGCGDGFPTVNGNRIPIRVDVLVKSKVPTYEIYCVSRGPEDRARFVRLAGEIANSIGRGSFHANPSYFCDSCEFRSRCPLWKRG